MTFIQRLLSTPVGDLLHRRVTGLGNWKQQLNDASLPDDIEQAIRTSADGHAFWRRTNHVVSLIESSQTSLAAGQSIQEIADVIIANTGTRPADDLLPHSVVAAVKQVVTRSKIRTRKKQSITNELLLHARTLLEHGESVEEVAENMTDSLALPTLIRQTGETPPLAELTIPEPVRAVINYVIHRTRLLKSEKADVAGELAAHFHDGLDSGQTQEELLASFGPIKPAAKLIRRSRLRCRPLPWKLWHRSWQIAATALVIVVVCWSVLIVQFRSATPNITFDLVAEHDAIASAIPVDDRAWPLYREGLLKLGPTESDVYSQTIGEEDAISLLLSGPASPEWPQAVEFLNTHNESIELFLRGTERSRLGFTHRSPDNIEWIRWYKNDVAANEYNPPGTLAFATNVQHVHDLRLVRSLISGRMFQAAEEDEPATVLSCFTGLLRLAEHAREDGFTVSAFCGMSMNRLASRFLAWIVQTHPQMFSDAQLGKLHDQLTAVLQTDWEIDPTVDAQMFFDEFLQHAYSPDGRFTPDGLHYLSQCSFRAEIQQDLAYVVAIDRDNESTSFSDQIMFNIRGSEAAAWIADRETMKRKFAEVLDRYREEFRNPGQAQQTSLFRAELTRLENSLSLKKQFLPILVMCQGGIPDLSFVSKTAPLQMRAECQGAMVAVAMEQFHRRHSRWPKELSELKPQFLTTLPVDPMSDQPLRYSIVNGTPHLYSVGPDQVDNGGAPVKAGLESALGDWLLLPAKLD